MVKLLLWLMVGLVVIVVVDGKNSDAGNSDGSIVAMVLI